LVGADLGTLLDRALTVACNCDPCSCENDGARLGAILGELAKMGRDKVTFIASPPIASFGDWVEQLIAESTGKEGKGILPVVGEPVGEPDVYSNDRLFVYLHLDGDDTYDAQVAALENAGQPVVRLRLRDRYDLGGQIFLWEVATAIASHRLGINPFDQPNVELAKRMAREMVNEYAKTGTLPDDQPAPLTTEVLHTFLAHIQPGDPETGVGRSYIAVQAYVQPTAETDAALLTLRAALRDKLHTATTVGYGPRFLHSTGQLHKGDAGKGFFIQVTADSPEKVPVPDKAGVLTGESSISFGVLKMAQALGDKRALQEMGRQVIRFHLGTDVIGGLKQLTKFLENTSHPAT
jgi:hypothetical protein